MNVRGCPLAVGFTLEKLSAHTIDEAGKEVFVHKNALELLRKVSYCLGSLQLRAGRNADSSRSTRVHDKAARTSDQGS